MSAYPLLSISFTALAVIVLLTALIVRRSRGQRNGQWMLLILATVVLLVLLTAVFDNVMIAAGLMVYATERTSGITIGLAPIEDFAYPLAAALLLPSLWTILRAERAHEH